MDVFERLARKLDELPQGFPRTESGVELKILRIIFAEDDAEMALQLTPVPETAEEIAARLGLPVDETRGRLDMMAKKGQIASIKLGGRQVYRLLPFVIGIYEMQRQNRLTHELAHLFEEYLPILCQVEGASPACRQGYPRAGERQPRASALTARGRPPDYPAGEILPGAGLHLPPGAGPAGPPLPPPREDLPALFHGGRRL